MFTIGQLAQRAGVGVESVRFYERQGLIERPRRPGTGYRRYPPETVERIVFIRRAALLGFTLREIAELLSLRARADAPCGRVRERATAKVADIDRRIEELQRIRAALARLVDACQGDRATAACSILGALTGAPDDTPPHGENEPCPAPPPRTRPKATRASSVSKRASGARRTV
jgi:MerR family mercuric resistance operon transcriptional regulator